MNTQKMKRPATLVSFLHIAKNPQIKKPDLNITSASPFPAWYFLALYAEAGREYYWSDKLQEPREELDAYCDDENKTLYTLMDEGVPAGFFILHEQAQNTDLAYFALMPGAVGKGYGSNLLDYAIATAWARDDMQSMSVETCTLDHERALPLYLSRGFVVIRQEERAALFS